MNDNSELILVGDFNLPNVNWQSGCVRAPSETMDRNLLNQMKFVDFFIQKGLTWHIKDQITRCRLVNGHLQESTLDQLLSSNMHLIESVETHAPLGRSDHLIIETTLNIVNEVHYFASNKRNWSKCDVSKVKALGENMDWVFNGAEWDIYRWYVGRFALQNNFHQ